MECPLWELKYHTTKYFNYLAHFPTAFWAANHGSIFTLLVVVSWSVLWELKNFTPSIFGQFPTL